MLAAADCGELCAGVAAAAGDCASAVFVLVAVFPELDEFAELVEAVGFPGLSELNEAAGASSAVGSSDSAAGAAAFACPVTVSVFAEAGRGLSISSYETLIGFLLPLPPSEQPDKSAHKTARNAAVVFFIIALRG